MSRLGEILEEESAGEINAILTEAESRAGRIFTEYKEKAEALLAEQRRKVDAEIRTAVRRAQSAAELTIATHRAQAKGGIMGEVRARALSAIEELSSRPDYGELLCALAEEASQALVAPTSVVSHPKDKQKLGDWAAARGLELKTDPELRLGVRIESGYGRTVENTLPERLHRAWDTLASEVARRLWE